MVGDVVLSPEELLARAAANVKSGKTAANASAVQKLLAQRDTPIEDTIELSPVQKILQAKEAQEAKASESYFDSDEFLQLKANQLRAQLAIYSNVPGLDPTGAVLNGIEAEIRDILEKQQAKLNETLEKSDEAQAKLAEQERLAGLAPVSAEDMLAKVQGTAEKKKISDAAQKLLDGLDIKA